MRQAGVAGLLQDMACGDAAAAAVAAREGGRGAAPMEMTAAVAADVCAFEGSSEAEGWRQTERKAEEGPTTRGSSDARQLARRAWRCASGLG